MTVIHARDIPSVWVTGPDATLRTAVARLLSCDPSIHVRGTSEGRVNDSATASIVVDEAMLEQLKTLSIGEFIDMIKSLPSTPPAPERHLRPLPSDGDMRTLLSERELEVVRLVADGLSNKQISRRMELSDKTVKNHVSHILAKLQLTARTQVAVHALRAGLV